MTININIIIIIVLILTFISILLASAIVSSIQLNKEVNELMDSTPEEVAELLEEQEEYTKENERH